MAVESAYIHIPFCSHKCDFCDFAAFAGVDQMAPEYCQTVVREIKGRLADDRSRQPLRTIFYGGGTPGYIDPDLLAAIQHQLAESIGIAESPEVTLETTPHSITVEKVRRWLDAGINRISIGIESLSDNELRAMGRDHTEAQALAGIEAARQGGFENLAVDLMYGLPEQTEDSWDATLNKLLACRPDHMSAYGLTIAGNSPLLLRYPLASTAYPSEDTFVTMYDMLVDQCAAAGLEQYEISNFAAVSKQSRHNITYWRNQEYYAFGVSAHRYVDGVRSSNYRSLNKYMRGFLENETEEVIDERMALQEGIFLGLRMTEGLDLDEFQSRYGLDLMQARGDKINQFLETGFLELRDRRINLTRKGFLLSNTIMSELFPVSGG